jgi:hypothetical protein
MYHHSTTDITWSSMVHQKYRSAIVSAILTTAPSTSPKGNREGCPAAGGVQLAEGFGAGPGWSARTFFGQNNQFLFLDCEI